MSLRYVVITDDPAEERTDVYHVIAADRDKARDFVWKVRPGSDIVLVVDEEMLGVWLRAMTECTPTTCCDSMRQAVKRQFGDVRERGED